MQPLKERSQADIIKTQHQIIDTAVSPVFSFGRFFITESSGSTINFPVTLQKTNVKKVSCCAEDKNDSG